MSSKTALMIAPNGARLTQNDHAGIPVTPEQTIHTALACREFGAQALHAHVRDDQQKHCLDVDRYAELLRLAKLELGDEFPVQVTTEAFGIYTAQQQMDLVRALKPRYISAAVRELIRDPSDETEAASFYAWARQEKIAVQHIVYDLEELHWYESLRTRGIVPADSQSLLMVMGRYTEKVLADENATKEAIEVLGSMNLRWMLCAFGHTETACLASASAAGGGMRVGFENSTQHADGTTAKNNEERVEQLVKHLPKQTEYYNANDLHLMLGGY